MNQHQNLDENTEKQIYDNLDEFIYSWENVDAVTHRRYLIKEYFDRVLVMKVEK